jgi:hypothetical protein
LEPYSKISTAEELMPMPVVVWLRTRSSCFHLCQVFGGLPQRYGHELPAVAVGEQVEALETRSLTLRREAFLGGGEELGTTWS